MPLIPFVRMSTRFSNLLSRSSAMCAAALTLAFGAACLNAGAQTTMPTHPPYVYTFTDLGALPGSFSYSESYAINESGDVVGDSQTSTGAFHAVLFKAGKIIDLGVLPGNNLSGGFGINGYDQVTGTSTVGTLGSFIDPNNPNGPEHAFLYSAGKMTDIGTLPGATYSVGVAINDSGQVAGDSDVSGFNDRGFNVSGFRYEAGKLTNLGAAYRSDTYTYALAINSFGQISGEADLNEPTLTQRPSPAVFSNGSIMFLNITANGNYPNEAVAINDTGQVTGDLFNPAESYLEAYIYSKGNLSYLGTLPGDDSSRGEGINAAGQIVGISYIASGDTLNPFLYTPGKGMVNLNSLLPAGSKWILADATAINDKGQITGQDINPQGYQHAYLLSPVFQSFSTLNTVAGTIGSPATIFAGGGTFVLGAKSNGIYPLAETTVLQLGGYHISIPPGSLANTNGVYFYQGKIGNATVYAAIRPMGSNAYLVGVVGEGVTGLPTSYPYNLTVTIGDDTGTQAITSNYDISALTEAEVCRDFGLPCGQ